MTHRKLMHGRYRIVGDIGEGGMGSVYLADDQRLPGRQCAIKRLAVPPGVDEAGARALRESFAREAVLLARLDHPALPKVSDHYEADGSSWLVMDYVPGQDLRAVLLAARAHGRQLDLGQIVGWGEDLCLALAYLHGQDPPICHRDVKPANVKLTPDGQIRLVDLGLACVVPGPDAQEAPTRSAATGGGTRQYQPLEQQADDAAPDPRSDLYSLGATLYHLACGRPPASARERFLDPSSLVRPRSLRPDMTERVEEAVLAALALHPDARPTSAEALRRMLVGPDARGGTSDWSDALAQNAVPLAVVLGLLLAAIAITLAP